MGTVVFIGLGSNLGHRGKNLKKAIVQLTKPSLQIQSLSSIYETLPMNSPPGSRPYLNAVLSGVTDLPPLSLLMLLQQIEIQGGRDWHGSNMPRQIDLDILLYGEMDLRLKGLVVPHPKMLERSFVLFPMQEIAPNLIHPVLGKRISLWANQLGELDLLEIRKISYDALPDF